MLNVAIDFWLVRPLNLWPVIFSTMFWQFENDAYHLSFCWYPTLDDLFQSWHFVSSLDSIHCSSLRVSSLVQASSEERLLFCHYLISLFLLDGQHSLPPSAFFTKPNPTGLPDFSSTTKRLCWYPLVREYLSCRLLDCTSSLTWRCPTPIPSTKQFDLLC